MPATHRYTHPEGKGLGQHHADAAGRKPRDTAALRAAGLPEADISVLAEHDVLMQLLDLPDGTEVERLEPDAERGLERIAWTDAQGSPRVTTIEPAFFAHFTAITGEA